MTVAAAAPCPHYTQTHTLRKNKEMAELPNFKLALVTGASMGIGAATAKLLASKGMTVILLARSRDKLEGVCKEI